MIKVQENDITNPTCSRKNKYTNNKILDESIKKVIKKLPSKIQKDIMNTKFIKINNGDSYYSRKDNIVYLLKDSDKHEILHELGYVLETKWNIMFNKEYINIQQNGIDTKILALESILKNGYDVDEELYHVENKILSKKYKYKYRRYNNDKRRV